MNNYLVGTNSLSKYLNEINRFSLLSREEEYTLAVRYHDNNDAKAAHKLVTSNLRFVVKVAMQFKSYGVKIKDLIQEGNLGLMVAVKKFNPKKGYRLISYAVWWIKAYIQKFILETYSLIKMGTTRAHRKLFASMAKVRKNLTQLDGQEPSDDLLANALDVDKKEVTGLKQLMASRNNSLDTTIGEDGTTHLEMLATSAPNQEETLGELEEQRSLHKTVTPFIENMKEKEKYIVQNRLLAQEPLTLQQIGNRFNISRERARQIESNVKKKIKGYLTEKGYAPSH